MRLNVEGRPEGSYSVMFEHTAGGDVRHFTDRPAAVAFARRQARRPGVGAVAIVFRVAGRPVLRQPIMARPMDEPWLPVSLSTGASQ